jgi:hypothetical protein
MVERLSEEQKVNGSIPLLPTLGGIMSKAIGGYVPRSKRKPYHEPRINSDFPFGVRHLYTPSGMVITIPMEPPVYQSPEPNLKFEQFDVGEE